ncbi:MAG: histidinol-phosphatase [Melioribacteraceae bacterium]|nr:histidinol-phosphatase [Melioribacteraceae bacterium]
MKLQDIENFMFHLAVESGKIIRSHFRKDVKIESKDDNSPVTIVDKKAEEKMREIIMREFPSHGIIGEEFENHNENSEFVWVLDPIDGTKSFISGMISFGTMIALLQNRKPLVGVINQPVMRQFLFGDGNITKLNTRQVKIRDCNSVKEAVLLTTDHLNVEKYQRIEPFEKLIRKVKLYRQWGDCYGYLLLATGFTDVMVDPIMSFWDTQALIPIIAGAGGVITDYQGNDPLKGTSIIAAGKSIHGEIIKQLNPD